MISLFKYCVSSPVLPHLKELRDRKERLEIAAECNDYLLSIAVDSLLSAVELPGISRGFLMYANLAELLLNLFGPIQVFVII